MTTGATEPASGRAQLTITKDSKINLSWGALVGLAAWLGVGTWQFVELRAAESKRVDSMVSSTNANVAQLAANTHQQIAALTSDLNYTSRTFEGYKSRFERADDNLQEIKILRHRVEQLEQSGGPNERRMHSIETRIEELYRITAELRVASDYLLRWLNPPGAEPPRKRNDRMLPRDGDQGVPAIERMLEP